MKKIERILFITPAEKKDITEYIEVGVQYWDMGVCVAITEVGDDTYYAEFDSKKTYKLNDVKRVLYSNG